MIAGSYAIALHIVIAILLFIGFNSESTTVVAPARVDIVQATVMDQQQVLDEIAERNQHFEQQKAEEQARLAALEKKAAEDKAAVEREALERENEKRKVEKEKQHLVELEQEKKAAEKAKQEAEIKRKETEEKQRLAEEKQKLEQKKEAELKQKKQQAEKQRKAEEAKKLKAEKEQKAAEEKQRRAAEEKAKKAEADRLLQDSLAAEEQEREAGRISSVVNQHMGMIRQRVKRYWSEPVNATQGMQCTLHVVLLPGGDVRKVSIVKSSGNAIFDRSAESAVYKAAPWPQPSDPKAAAKLRDFKFVFNPK